jgi:hypothetical protein
MIPRQAYQQYRAGTYFLPSCQLRPAKDKRTPSVASMFAICRRYSGQLHLALLCMHSISKNAIACLVPQCNGCLAKHSSAVTAFLGYSGRFLTRNLAKLGCNKVCEPWTFKMCTQEHPRTPNGPKIDECSRWAHLLVCDKFRSECESFGYRMGGEVSCVTRPCIVGF